MQAVGSSCPKTLSYKAITCPTNPEDVNMAVSSTLGAGGWSEAGWLPNFEKLVLACMDSYDRENVHIRRM